jgi:hypothetical protein
MSLGKRRGRYFISRVIKLGQLNQLRLIETLLNAPVVPIRNHEWTITDVTSRLSGRNQFVFGNLAKYSRRGTVKVIDEPRKRQMQAVAPNLLEASSPFVYLPEFSGIAYMHVWNDIQEEVFPRRLKAIVEAAFDRFFVECVIEPVSDYRQFLQRLRSMDRITEIQARVHPPNPLFGRLWESLDAYVKRRGADEVSVRETSEKREGLSTQLVQLVEGAVAKSAEDDTREVDIADAAILMAADGYGSGKIIGRDGDQEVVVRTSDSQLSFVFSKEPDPEAFASAARTIFKRVKRERKMRH